MEYITLANGVKMPLLGYGVYQVDPAECERCVTDAIAVGYRSIDTAQAYHNEEGVGNAVRKSGLPREDFFNNPTLQAIGAKYGKSVAQTALRFLIQSDVVVIPKSTHKERMAENLDVFDFQLSQEDMVAIRALDDGQSAFFSHYDPATVEFLTSLGR